MRSLGCRARSPASVGVYAYKAVAIDNTGGPAEYDGGGGLETWGFSDDAFSFRLTLETWLVGGEKEESDGPDNGA